MTVTITDEELEVFIRTGKSNGKYKKLARDKKFAERLVYVYTILCSVAKTADLKPYSFLHYEQLKYQKGNIIGSVRIMNGRVERLLFNETEDGIEIIIIELNDDHYGNKK